MPGVGGGVLRGEEGVLFSPLREPCLEDGGGGGSSVDGWFAVVTAACHEAVEGVLDGGEAYGGVVDLNVEAVVVEGDGGDVGGLLDAVAVEGDELGEAAGELAELLGEEFAQPEDGDVGEADVCPCGGVGFCPG